MNLTTALPLVCAVVAGVMVVVETWAHRTGRLRRSRATWWAAAAVAWAAFAAWGAGRV